MEIEEFKQKRIEGRRQLLERIVETFRLLKPLAIHQFGSGTKGFKDEFSDIDIWVTFKDSEIDGALKKLGGVYREIAPVLLRHQSKTWSPVGGNASSIIHETEFGLFVVDYYVSKHSETVLKNDARVLYGNDSLKRGEWRLNKEFDKKVRDTHTQRKDTDLLIDLIFISIKGIVRGWEGEDFVKTLRTGFRLFRKKYGAKMKRRVIRLEFRVYLRLLSDLYKIANKRQRRAIGKIRRYIKEVECCYG